MEHKKTFLGNGNIFTMVDSGFNSSFPLPVGVYNLFFVEMEGLKLQRLADKFEFPFKTYGLDVEFKQHVLEMYQKLDHSMGILLNGTKGTGKTVTAKQICNEIQLPVIVISKPLPGYIEFISNIEFPCIFFFDEFEKNFSKGTDEDEDKSSALLSVLDGVYSSTLKHVFLLTTNQSFINDNFLSRPGRIRYFRTYGNLDEAVVRQYLNDNLKNPDVFNKVFNAINELEIVTIDILKAVVEEVNLSEQPIEKIIKFMNVAKAKNQYRVFTREVDVLNIEDSNLIPDFLEDINKLGKSYTDNDGETQVYDQYDLNLRTRQVHSAIRAIELFKDTEFGSMGRVIVPYDPKTQTVIIENNYGDTLLVYICNPESMNLHFVL